MPLVVLLPARAAFLPLIEPARDLRAHDSPVVPVDRPRAAGPDLRRIGRAPIVVRHLERLRRIAPVEDRDPALIPPLYHHLAPGDRNERAVVRNAVLERRLRRGNLVVRVELQLA